MTSPPADLIASILDWSVPPVSGREPSHFGLQPPSERMNARVNHLTPVAGITEGGCGGLPPPGHSKGATAMPGETAALFRELTAFTRISRVSPGRRVAL